MGQFSLIDDIAQFSTLNEMFDSSTQVFSDRIVFRIKKENSYREYSYQEFRRNVLRIAAFLHEEGIGRGKKVGIISENRPEWGMAYFAALVNGAVVVPVDALLGASELEHIANDAGIKALFFSGQQFDKVNESLVNLKTVKNFIQFDDFVDSALTSHRTQMIGLDTILADEKRTEADIVRVKPDTLAALIYTSGTTGSSKGVMLSHNNLASNVSGLRRMIYFDENDVFLSVLPLHHTFECTTGFLIPVSKGSSITYAESLASKRIIANIRETGVTIMMGVPLLYEKMVGGLNRGIAEKGLPLRLLFKTMMGMVRGMKKVTGRNLGKAVFRSVREKSGLASLRLMISGGAPLQPWVAHTFEHLGINFLNGYGLTETSPVLCVNIIADVDNRTVGYPVYDIELAIRDTNDQGVGELLARGAFVMQGYYQNKEATREVIRDGWFHTGDLASFDNKGRVLISGRCKNLIVTTGGKNVYPEEIELHLNDSPYILESLVMGREISSENKGEEVVAYIVPDYEYIDSLHTHARITSEKIEEMIRHEIQDVNSLLVSYKRIKDCFIREEEFPKTSTRKIKRYLFKDHDVHLA